MADENLLSKRGLGRPKEPVKVEVPALEESIEVSLGDDDKVELTGKELKALKALLAGNQESKDNSVVSALIEALRESQKPYKSDADKENDRRQQEQMREMGKKARISKAYEQVYCGHMAGQKGDTPHPFATAIAWHEIHEHLWWGICTACQREFWPNDADYGYWRRKQSFSNGAYNKGSRAGERGGTINSNEWVTEQHAEPFGRVIGATPSIPADISSTVWNLPATPVR